MPSEPKVPEFVERLMDDYFYADEYRNVLAFLRAVLREWLIECHVEAQTPRGADLLAWAEADEESTDE